MNLGNPIVLRDTPGCSRPLIDDIEVIGRRFRKSIRLREGFKKSTGFCFLPSAYCLRLLFCLICVICGCLLRSS